ncbi:MAG: macro domain-containing protein [Alphaproteobacteria bacterium]
MDIVISDSGDVAKPFIEYITVARGDIALQSVDAVVMTIPRNLDFCGGINNSIAAACGYDLDSFILDNIYKPKPGEVYALPGGNLPAQHIFVGITPYYRTEFDRKEGDMVQIVRRVMELAHCMLVERIAIPSVCSGRKCFPKSRAARFIVQGVYDRMYSGLEEVRLVGLDDQTLHAFESKLFAMGRAGSS